MRNEEESRSGGRGRGCLWTRVVTGAVLAEGDQFEQWRCKCFWVPSRRRIAIKESSSRSESFL